MLPRSDSEVTPLIATTKTEELQKLLVKFRQLGVTFDTRSHGLSTEIAADLWTLNIVLWNVYMADNAWLHRPSCAMQGALGYQLGGPAGFFAMALMPGWQLRAKAKYFIRHFNEPSKYSKEPSGFDHCAPWVKQLSACFEYFFTFSGGVALVEPFLPQNGQGFDCIAEYYTNPLHIGLQVLVGFSILSLMFPRLREMYTEAKFSHPKFAEWGYFIGTSLGKAVPFIRSIYTDVHRSGHFDPQILKNISLIIFGTANAYVTNKVLNGQFLAREPTLPTNGYNSIESISGETHARRKAWCLAITLFGLLAGKVAYNGLAYDEALNGYGYDGQLSWVAILSLVVFSIFLMGVNCARTFSFIQ